MGIMSGIKSTYQFAKGELKKDVKRSPTLSRTYKKTKKTIRSINPKNIKTSKLKRGKSISNEKVFKKLKKGVPKSKYSRIKYKKKKMSQVRSEIFSTRLNI